MRILNKPYNSYNTTYFSNVEANMNPRLYLVMELYKTGYKIADTAFLFEVTCTYV